MKKIRHNRNTIRNMLALCLCTFLLAGCGTQTEKQPEASGSSHIDVQKEVEELPMPSELDDTWQRLSMQFWKGEIVQIWAQKELAETENLEEGARPEILSADIYLYHEDGGRELLMADVPKAYVTKWFVDEDGGCYVLSKAFFKLNKDGKKLYQWAEEPVQDICQLQDGRIILLIGNTDYIRLAELNPDTGEVTEKTLADMGESVPVYIAAGENGLLVLDEEGVWEVDTEGQPRFCAMSFEGTSYSLASLPEDFRILEGGQLQILVDGVSQTLQLVDIRQSRTLITLAGTAFDFWIHDWAEQFNKENQEYYVVIEKPAFDLTMQSENEFVERMGVEIATGGGPDIICGGMLTDAYGLIEKGGLVDLTPYMEAAGMKAEDYFPATFNHWRYGDGIYGAITWLDPRGMAMSQAVLSGGVAPKDVESLVNDLYHFPEKARASQYSSANSILAIFLKYSKSLCKTVDWENGSCDFSGELFAKILEICKRYGDNRNEEVPEIWVSMDDNTLYIRDTAEELLGMGMVPVWYMFDEGCYPVINPYKIMGINSNSPNKEGAWAFLSYILSEEVQLETARHCYDNVLVYGYPASRTAFETVAAEELAEGSIGTTKMSNGVVNPFYKAGQQEIRDLNWDADAYHALYDLTEADVEEVRWILENAKPQPIYTEAVVEIVREEAGAYFAGDKSIEQVCKVIQNRVQLYLEEHR